jgi:outer membrane lipoprotein carrier protein
MASTAKGAPAPDPAAAAIARRIQERHHNIRDLKARFTQTYDSSLLGRQVVERGTLSLKRPDRMLWEYQEPEKKLFVSDGHKSYFYVPEDRQVVVHESAGDKGVALDLLSGRSDLLAQFDVSPVEGSPRRIRLVPRSANAEVREVVVEADATGRIEWLELIDLQGSRSSFRFEGIKENVGLSDRLFEFQIPRGVEVVTG